MDNTFQDLKNISDDAKAEFIQNNSQFNNKLRDAYLYHCKDHLQLLVYSQV